MTKVFDHVMTTDTLLHDKYRWDAVFSNWIYVWFGLYFVGAVKYSPLLPILVGIVANTYEYFQFKDDKSTRWGNKYLLWNLNIKILPAVILLYQGVRIRWKQDCPIVLLVYGLFLLWMYVNGFFESNKMNPFNFNAKYEKLE